MADADPIPHAPHPATVRQAGYLAWIDDPAIARLFEILRDLHSAGARLDMLHLERPDIGAATARGDVGAVVALYERRPERAFDYVWHIRANGGACAALWQLLVARRDAWIEARLEIEGFAPFASSAAKTARILILCSEAISVESAWERFSTGVFDFTSGADSPRMGSP